MTWVFGSIPIIMYPISGEEVTPTIPYLLLTTLAPVLTTNNAPIELSGG